MLLLGILGTILKIIGIVLLIILLFLLIFLIVPVRYRIQLSKEGGKLEAAAEASYFLRCVRLLVTFREKKLAYKAKVLCFTCLSSEMEKNPSGKKAKKRGKGEKAETEDNAEAEEKPGPEEKTETDGSLETEGNPGTEGNSETEGNSKTEGKPETEENSETEALPDGAEAKDEKKREESSTADGSNTADESNPTEETIKSNNEEMQNPQIGDSEKPESPGIFRRLIGKIQQICSLPWQLVKKIKGKIQDFIAKIKAFRDNIRGYLQKALSILQQGRTKYGYLKEFLQDEVNKNGIKYTGKTILGLLKHVAPYKMKGEIILGTGNPYSLGQILSVLGMLYPLYAKNLAIKADFESEGFRLEGKVLLKGRIRLGSILILLIRLWFKGKLRKCLRNAMALKDRLLEPASMK